MKKTISIITVALLVATCAMLLVACGGIGSADEWGKAMEAYSTASAVTIKIEDNHKMMNNLANKERLLSTAEVAFDEAKGLVYVNMDYTRRNFWESDVGVGSYEIYYVLDGANVISYKKNLRTQLWEDPSVQEFATQEAAKNFLREKYLKPTDTDGREFPILTNLKFEDFKANMFGSYEWRPTDSRFKYTYVLKFTNGKPSTFTYEHKTSAGNVDDSRKFSMTVNYSANITLPNDLPEAK